MNRFFISRKQWQSLKIALSLVQISKARFLLAIFLGTLGLGSAVALSAASAWLIARASQMPPILYLEVAIVCVRLFGISKALFRYVERLVSHEIAVGGMGTLRANVYRKLASGDTAKVSSIRSGDMLARMGDDVDAIGDFLVKSLLPAATALSVGTFTVLGIAFISPAAAFYLALGLLISGVVAPLMTMRSTLIAQSADATARKDIANTAMYVTQASAQISTSGQRERVFQTLNRQEEQLSKAKDKAAYPSAWASATDHIAMMGAVIMAAYIGIYGVADASISEVSLSVLALTPLAAFEATGPLGMAAMQLVRSSQAAERIVDLLDLDTLKDKVSLAGSQTAEITEQQLAQLNQILNTNPEALTLVAKDLSIGWPGGPTIASGINFAIKPGENLAIVGPSGIGKTTLLYTLSGMIPPHGGSVEINGVPVASLPREVLANFISMTTEDAHIFQTTLLENIRVARGDISETEAYHLAKAAGLSTWLDNDDALNIDIGSGATTISGGERRRLLLARALGTKAPFMVVDEPGEHLDPQTADALIRDLLTTDRQDTKRAVVLVTHRITPLDQANQVVLIGHPAGISAAPAQILDHGTHQELIARNQGYAWNLAQEQDYESAN